jgi:hypothetical protein
MHKSAMKCNETVGKCCKNKHGASKIIDTSQQPVQLHGLVNFQIKTFWLEACYIALVFYFAIWSWEIQYYILIMIVINLSSWFTWFPIGNLYSVN